MSEEGYKPSKEEIKSAEDLMTDEQRFMSYNREHEIELFKRRESFSRSDIYKTQIEPFLKLQESPIDKMLFAESLYRYDKDFPLKILNEENQAYCLEFIQQLEEQLRTIVKTPKDLDSFLHELLEKYKSSLLKQDSEMSDENFERYIGHSLGHAIAPLIDKLYARPHSKLDATEEDIDWIYTLMKHLYMWATIFNRFKKVYRQNISNPKSLKMREYLLTKGSDINEEI